ncbi:MAG TPA: hypothetical protein VF555_14400 [Variovorax sp.]
MSPLILIPRKIFPLAPLIGFFLGLLATVVLWCFPSIDSRESLFVFLIGPMPVALVSAVLMPFLFKKATNVASFDFSAFSPERRGMLDEAARNSEKMKFVFLFEVVGVLARLLLGYFSFAPVLAFYICFGR